LEALKFGPLAAQDLPPAVAGLVKGASPVKLMAVRGMAPLRPAELLTATYQLSFDADAAVKAAAEAAPTSLPDKILLGPLGEPLPAQVLHFFAERLPASRAMLLEKILYNHATADETFVFLAGKLDENALEIIFQNEVRLLRCPQLVEALYLNKRARMSSVSRALELCARNQVNLEAIPGYAEVAAAITSDAGAMKPSESDEAFQAAMVESAAPDATIAQGEAPAEGEDSKRSAIIKFDKLKIFEKVRLATVGNAYCRSVLIRDTNKLVAMSVIRSPALTDGEILAAAGNRAICEDVIRYIANNRQFTKDYSVKQALVNNPKCPLGSALRLLSFLHPDDLKAVSRSKSIPGALSTSAKKLIQTRDKK
jgi:hypothetical protein